MLWQFWLGGGPSAFGIYMFSLCTGISLYLPIILPLVSTCLLYVLLFPYIFLLFDCFEWVLIDRIEKCRGHSALWQFQMGGSISFTQVNLKIWAHLLLFPYIFILFCLWYLHVCSMCCYFLISSYYLTVSNGCSLTVLKSIEVTQHSGSFKWGEGGSIGRFTLNLPILSSLAVSCFASQKVFLYYIWKT